MLRFWWRRLVFVLVLSLFSVSVFDVMKLFSKNDEFHDTESTSLNMSHWFPHDKLQLQTKRTNHNKTAQSTIPKKTVNKHSVEASTRNIKRITFRCIQSLKVLLHQGKEFNISNEADLLPVCRGASLNKLKQFTARRHQTTIVPNIAHYVWFGQQTFRFDHLISLLSAYRIMKANKIMFHTDNEPTGEYWEEARKTIDNLKIIKREQPESIFGYSLMKSKIQHKADIARLEILMEYGGVYMDNDVIVVQSLEPLRHYSFVMGRESETRLNNGVIIAKSDSKFLRWYYRGYRYYRRQCWNCDSILYPNALAIQYPELIHIEDDSLVKPNWDESWKIFIGHYEWWEAHYTIHTFIRNFYRYPQNRNKEINYNKEIIKKLNSAFGEICRYVYYGKPDLIKHYIR